MDLQGENRILVKEGLKRLRHTPNFGLQELAARNNLSLDQIDVYHIGFVLGPCLNASGRLDTAARALKLLLTDSREEAARLAGDLKDLNESRKAMTLQGEQEAIEMVEHSEQIRDRVLVVFSAGLPRESGGDHCRPPEGAFPPGRLCGDPDGGGIKRLRPFH